MAIPGGITEVDLNENGLKMDGLARFAVDEHNKKEDTLLEFQKVVSAKQQVVAGILYYITLEATDGGHKKVYEAKIWEKLPLKSKELQEELQEFKLIAGSPSDSSA